MCRTNFLNDRFASKMTNGKHVISMYAIGVNKSLYFADLESQVTDQQLRKISVEIGDIWYQVGLELGLRSYVLNTIKLDNPSENAKASLKMLFKWKEVNENASREILNKAIKECRAKKGTLLNT